MKAAPFEYHRPPDLQETLQLIAQLDDAKLLAGGQSLMPMMNFRYLTPSHLIDLNRVPQLRGISMDGDDLLIGAMTRQHELARSVVLQEHCPLIVEALHFVGHVQTRNRGTLGGSLCHLDPAAELPGVMLALDAVLEVASVRGTRSVPISQWPTMYMTPDLEADELLTGIRIALHRPHSGLRAAHGFCELARRHGDFALAGAAVALHLDGEQVCDVAIAVIGVDESAQRLDAAEDILCGGPLNADTIEQASALAMDLPGMDDVHANALYRRRIARVMVRRALDLARQRAFAQVSA
ncbi:MAG: carbon-monoxide dehydrogenase medium subunit [Gammaproteobacteria bacterium]|jgi:carbon-monoxide dehydrogenase medium subunit